MDKEAWTKIKGSKLANARLYICKYAPYWRSLLYAMAPAPIEGMTEKVGGPMGLTDKLVLLYDPDWIDKEDEKVLAFGLVHEILHAQLQFHARAKSFVDVALYSLAQDLFINPLLSSQQVNKTKQQDGTTRPGPLWKVPDWVALPHKYGLPPNFTADKYYELLLKDKQQQGVRYQPKRVGFCAGACGSITGKPILQELEQQLNLKMGRSTSEVRRIVRESAKEVQKANEVGRGLFPGSFLEEIDELFEDEKVRWQDLLANTTRYAIGAASSGGTDYSRSRPSRRSYLRGWTIPGLIAREVVVAVVIDSSGSMQPWKLKRAVTETAGVLHQTGIERLWLLIVDADVQAEARWVTIQELERLAIPGRGGTSFVPGVEAVDRLDPRPDVTIYFTDGDGTAPQEAPEDMQFIWGLIDPYTERNPAGWGDVVLINEEDEAKEG
jgi:predicted metal-dependent peptidase